MQGFKKFSKQIILILLTGLFSGIIGALFSHSVSFVTNFRNQNGWILFLLPLGGILTVFIYKKLGTTGLSTDAVLGVLKGKETVSPLLLPSVFCGTVITHLLGGSAGREGAALQMGGSVATVISKRLGLSREETRLATVCGMAAFFSALFGTPLAAAVFSLEVVFDKRIFKKGIIPTLFTSLLAFLISQGLLCHPERFALTLPKFSLTLLWKALILILIACGVCVIFLWSLKFSKNISKKLLKNPYIKAIIGGIILIILTLAVGCRDYNGGGLDIVERIFSQSQVKSEAFLLKIIFTAITISAGFKGGEIVPTIFIGATFGGALALALGFSAPFGAAIGVAALFSGATSCPIAAVILCGEMFGFKGILYFAIAGFISYFITGKNRLYSV